MSSEPLEHQVEGALDVARRALQEVEELKAELEKEREARKQYEQRLSELEERTALRNEMIDAASLEVEERAGIIVQTLVNDAQQNPNGNKASMDIKAGWDSLNRSLDRTRLYDVYRRAESIADDRFGEDQDAVTFVKEKRSAPRNSRLVVDLDELRTPVTIGETTVTTNTE